MENLGKQMTVRAGRLSSKPFGGDLGKLDALAQKDHILGAREVAIEKARCIPNGFRVFLRLCNLDFRQYP
jgi:hypothetical protein